MIDAILVVVTCIAVACVLVMAYVAALLLATWWSARQLGRCPTITLAGALDGIERGDVLDITGTTTGIDGQATVVRVDSATLVTVATGSPRRRRRMLARAQRREQG